MTITINLIPIIQVLVALILAIAIFYGWIKLQQPKKVSGLTFEQIKAKGQAKQERIEEIKSVMVKSQEHILDMGDHKIKVRPGKGNW